MAAERPRRFDELIRYASLPLAIGLVLVLASQSMAASWSLPVKVLSRPSTNVFIGGLVTPSGSTAVVVYDACNRTGICYSVEARRTTDGGSSWDPPVVLSNDGYSPSIGGRGQSVDVAWIDHDHTVKYARSTNGGQSFPRIKKIGFAEHPGETSIARGPNGLVAVAWVQNSWTGKLKARVSTDGGYSFGAAQTIATGSYQPGIKLAVGNGVVYAAYIKDETLLVRRSVDGGASWSAPRQISEQVSDTDSEQFSITAEGSDGFVAYRHASDALRYRHSADKGATWTAEGELLKASPYASTPDIYLQGGVLRAVFQGPNGLFYRESFDGVTWSAKELVSEIGYGGFVGFAGRPLVVYTFSSGVDQSEVRARYRTP